MTKDEALKLALEALQWNWGGEPLPTLELQAINAIKEALAQPEQEPVFIKHEVESAEDWSEWVCPNPHKYLMKCCDCGLVHEAQFGVVRYKSEDEREACDFVDDPNLQAVFRMRRSEQWSPEDTAHRAGGLPMAQPEQEPVANGIIRTLVSIDKDGIETWKHEPFYTAPPKRELVGLTDEQLIAAYESEQQGRYGDHIRSLRAIEAAHGIKGE